MNDKDVEKLDLEKLSLKDVDEYVAEHEKKLKYKRNSKDLIFKVLKTGKIIWI